MSSEYDEGITISASCPKVTHFPAIERFAGKTRWPKSVDDELLAAPILGSHGLPLDQIPGECEGRFFDREFSFHELPLIHGGDCNGDGPKVVTVSIVNIRR